MAVTSVRQHSAAVMGVATARKKEWVLTAAAFEGRLQALDPDREQATVLDVSSVRSLLT